MVVRVLCWGEEGEGGDGWDGGESVGGNRRCGGLRGVKGVCVRSVLFKYSGCSVCYY